MITETNISEYRLKKLNNEFNIIEFTNLDQIISVLEPFGLVNKPYGFLSGPYEKYFEIGYIDKNGILNGYIDNHNIIHVKLSNQKNIDRIRYFNRLEITQCDDNYHIVAIAQLSTESVCYQCDINELEECIKKIFISVK